jgi:hypothetical protein
VAYAQVIFVTTDVYLFKENIMLLQHEEYQSSFDKAIACMVECEHCAEACRTAAETYR